MDELKIELTNTVDDYNAKRYFISVDLDKIYDTAKGDTVAKDTVAKLDLEPSPEVQDEFTSLLQLMESNKGWPKTYNKYYEADTFQLQFEMGRFAEKEPDYIYIQETDGVGLISGMYFLNKNGKYYNYKPRLPGSTKIHEIIIYKEPKSNKIVFSYDGSLLFINGTETDDISRVIFDVQKKMEWAEMSWTFSTELKTTIMGELQKISFVGELQRDVSDEFKKFIINYEIYNKSLSILKLKLKLPDVNKDTVANYISIRNTYRAYMDINKKITPLESSTLQFTIQADTNEIKDYLYCKSNINGNYIIKINPQELPYFVNDKNVTLKFKHVVMYKDIFNGEPQINDDKDDAYYQKWVLDNSNESNCDKKLLFCLYIPLKETIFSSNTDNWFWSGIIKKRAVLKNIPQKLEKNAISLKYDQELSNIFPKIDDITSFFCSNQYIKDDEDAEAAKAAEAEAAKAAKAVKAAEAKAAKAVKAAEAEAAKAAKAAEAVEKAEAAKVAKAAKTAKAAEEAEKARVQAEEKKKKQSINKQTLLNTEYETRKKKTLHSQSESVDASLLDNSDSAEDADNQILDETGGIITDMQDHNVDEEENDANIQSRGGPTSDKPQTGKYLPLKENSGQLQPINAEVNINANPTRSKRQQTVNYNQLEDGDDEDTALSKTNQQTQSVSAQGPGNADDWDDDDDATTNNLKPKFTIKPRTEQPNQQVAQGIQPPPPSQPRQRPTRAGDRVEQVGGKKNSKRKTIHTYTRKSYNKYNSNYSSPKRMRYTDRYLDII